MKIRPVDNSELGTCPAAVVMGGREPVVEVNTTVWNNYTPYQQRFILAHELGHWTLNTDSEIEADRYAIRQVAGTAPRSLKQALHTLYQLGCIPYERMLALYKECLKIDQEQKQKPTSQDSSMKKIHFNPNAVLRVEGEEEALNLSQKDTSQMPPVSGLLQDITLQKAGFRIKQTFVSLECVLLAAILIVLIYFAHKCNQ